MYKRQRTTVRSSSPSSTSSPSVAIGCTKLGTAYCCSRIKRGASHAEYGSESHSTREKGSSTRRVQHVCSGLPVASSTLRRLTSNPAACCTSHRGTPCAATCARHTPKYLLGKNLLPEKYLGSKYLSRSRFLGNIPRVIFGREIFPENIPRKTLLAVPKNWKHHQIFVENIHRKKQSNNTGMSGFLSTSLVLITFPPRSIIIGLQHFLRGHGQHRSDEQHPQQTTI